ncbi:MAG: hypothetical protein HWN65_10115 [Candidatus Helarchaeota archaeon]|nr:hypothetical protein [Candidatus Helarchaeota archaeon]
MLDAKLSCEFKYPYFSDEEEIRCEMINTIFDNVSGIELWDCRSSPCPDPILINGFPFVPPTGDILYRRNGEFETLELKFATMRSQVDRGSYYRALTSGELTLLQLDLLRRGVLTLVFIGEIVRDPSKWGITIDRRPKGKRPKSEPEEEIKKLRGLFGQEKICYEYIIINQKNLNFYDGYFNKLRPQNIKSRTGRVVAKKIMLRLEKMVDEMTSPEERYCSIKSKLCLEIVKNLFKV